LSTKNARTQVSKGFKIERRYFSVYDDNLIRDPYGRYVTLVGSLIQIVIKVSTLKKRHHLVLIDECPSAMEPLPEQHSDEGDDAELGYGLQWYQHQRIRQNRLEIYTTILYPGEHIYTHYARTTNTGMFHVPPARVEEMYNNHYGMSSKDMIIVRGASEDLSSYVPEEDQPSLSRKSSVSKARIPSRTGSSLEPVASPRKLVSHSPRSGNTTPRVVANLSGGVLDDVITLDSPKKTDSKKNKKGKAEAKTTSLSFDDDGFQNISF